MNRKLKADVLSEFCRQIGAMTGAGITMTKSVEILKNVTENRRIAKVYGELERRIRQGNPIGDSMEEIGSFPEMMVNMFRAAEASGQLERTANHLAEHYRKEHRLSNQIRSATLYPKLLCIMAFSIVLFIFLVIMPMVEPLFEGVELPAITRGLITISEIIKHDWHMVLSMFLLALILCPGLSSLKSVRKFSDRIILYLPVIGKQMRIIYTARFARCHSSLYASGVSMIKSLEIASRTLGNVHLENQFEKVVQEVANGIALSRAIETVEGLDKKLSAIVYVGEETGKLDVMLASIAESYEHESEMAISRMVSLIEPFMIVIVGILVAIILLGIMVPMWSMYEYIG